MAYDPKKRAKAILKKLKKYKGKSYLTAAEKQKMLENSAKKMEKNKTWPEKEFERLLKEIGVVYESQKIVGQKIFDYYIPSKNMLVEIDGDYYHGNPETNKDLNRMQQKNIKNDKFKTTLANGHGYFLERVWESELKDKYDEVKYKFQIILNS